MEAKDTVLSLEQREVFREKCHKAVAIYLGEYIPDIKLSEMDSNAIQICKNVALKELEAQAAFSFRAGYNQCHLDDTDCLADVHEAGKQEGRKEVIEWIKEHQIGNEFSAISIPKFTYLTKLKEWGIDA